MAFLANYPIAVAPAMGHNFFFAFTVVAGIHYPWQVALGAVFISGIVFLIMSLWGVREALVHAIPVIFIFFFLDLFDSIGSLIGIAEQGGFMRNGLLPRAREALLADAIGTTFAGLLGNSPVVSYIESAAGVAEGARTGLANVITGMLMLSGLFFSPLAQMKLELLHRRRLIGTETPDRDVRDVIILAAGCASRHSTQHRDLPHVRQRIRDGTLKQPIGGTSEPFIRCKPSIECVECGEKSRDFLIPWQWPGVMPHTSTVRDRETPIEQIADVRENLQGRAFGRSCRKLRELGRRIPNCSVRAICKRGESVPKRDVVCISHSSPC